MVALHSKGRNERPKMSGPDLYSGWLTKHGKKNKKGERRFFLLLHGRLYWFKGTQSLAELSSDPVREPRSLRLHQQRCVRAFAPLCMCVCVFV